MSLSPIREEICRHGRSLFDRGYTHGTSGNISVLLDDGRMLVTPTNASLGDLDPAALCLLDADGRSVDGPAPTKELPLHSVDRGDAGDAPDPRLDVACMVEIGRAHV